MSGSYGGFRLALCLYVHGFCEAVGRGIWLESRISFAWLCHRRHDGWAVLPIDRPPDRSLRPPSHYSSLHDGVRLRHCLAGPPGLRAMAVLSDVLCDRCGWQRRSTPGLCAVDLDMVSATIGYGSGLRNGRSRLRRHDPAGHCAIRCHSIWLEGGIPRARRDFAVVGLAAQLAVYR
jgi:hypothetical protein